MKLMMTNLFCGDNVEVLRREVADNSIQLTVTSPPYDNLRKYNGFTWDFEGVASELYRVTKPASVPVAFRNTIAKYYPALKRLAKQ